MNSHIRVVTVSAANLRAVRVDLERLRHARGVAVVLPLPGTALRSDLAPEILTALHKDSGLSSLRRSPERGWNLVRTWLEAETVADVVLWAAGFVDGRLARQIAIEWGQDDIRSWWVYDGTSPKDWWPQGAAVALDEFRDWAHQNWSSELPERGVVTTLPADGFLTFRSSCRALLPDDEFCLVDGWFEEAFAASTRWLARWQPVTGEMRPLGDAGPGWTLDVHTFLCNLTASSDESKAVVQVRAAQAAFLIGRVLLSVNLSGERGLVDIRGHDSTHRAGPSFDQSHRLSPEQARRIGRLLSPTDSAGLVMCLIGRRSARHLVALKFGDLIPSGEAFTIEASSYTVPERARSCLRAILHERRTCGASEASPLFVDGRREPLTHRVLGNRLCRAALLCGIDRTPNPSGALWREPPVPTGRRSRLPLNALTVTFLE